MNFLTKRIDLLCFKPLSAPRTLLLCLLLSASGLPGLMVPLRAQSPVVSQAAHLPQAGDVVLREYFQANGLNPGPSGQNVSWNFTALAPTATVDTGRYAALASPYPFWDFNLAYEFSAPNYPWADYYVAGGDSLMRAGQNHGAADFDPVEFRNPALFLKFPMVYGDQHADDFSGVHQSIAGPQTFTGRSHVTADAYGTVFLPADTFTQVLRIHVLDTVQATLFPTTIVNSCYFYFDASRRYPVLTICDQFGQGMAFASRVAPVGTHTEVALAAEPLAYPVPADAALRLRLPEGVQATGIQVHDLNGRLVYEGPFSEQLRCQDWPEGIYLLQVNSIAGQFTQKIAIQH